MRKCIAILHLILKWFWNLKEHLTEIESYYAKLFSIYIFFFCCQKFFYLKSIPFSVETKLRDMVALNTLIRLKQLISNYDSFLKRNEVDRFLKPPITCDERGFFISTLIGKYGEWCKMNQPRRRWKLRFTKSQSLICQPNI